MEQKYNLRDCTTEESESFMKDFNELLKKHLVYFEPVPQYIREDLKSPWRLTCQILLQKKTEVVEPKEAVPSPFTDESTKEA